MLETAGSDPTVTEIVLLAHRTGSSGHSKRFMTVG